MTGSNKPKYPFQEIAASIPLRSQLRRMHEKRNRYRHADALEILEWVAKNLDISLDELAEEMDKYGIDIDGTWIPPKGFHGDTESHADDARQRELIETVLAENMLDVSATADILELSRNALEIRMRVLGIVFRDYEREAS